MCGAFDKGCDEAVKRREVAYSMEIESKVIGIDLGTTNSVVAFAEAGQPIVIPNTEGGNRTPSVVAFLDTGEVVVGEIARRQAATNPKRTIYSVKRLMGRKYEDIEESGDVFTYDIVNQDDDILIDIDGMGYKPHQISALILRKLKESAEQYLGEEARQAIITVPAYFDDLQRNATIEAARMAGLEVLRLINEPTAAALAYGLGREQDEVVAVYDFGGGTFDISVLDVSKSAIEVLTSTGNSHLGGDDLDNAVVRLIVEEFLEKHGVDLTRDPVTLRRLKEVAEKAKCELSTMTHTVISLPFIAYEGDHPLHLDRPFSRGEFEELVEEFVNQTITCCRRAIEEAGISKKDLAKVILVGGTTRIPMVQDAVEDFFGLTPFKGVNPDEIVALGAATQAGVFQGNVQEVVLLDVTPHSIGIEVKNGRYSRIIEKNSTIPIKAAKTFTTTEDDQSFVNIHILQGESENAADNRSLGKFTLADIPQAKSGVPRIRVTFFVNSDGVMEITATEMGSGKEKSLTIVHSELSEEERHKRRRRRTRRRGRTSIAPSRTVGGAFSRTPEGSEGLLEGVQVRQDRDQPTGPPTSVDNGAPMFRMVGESEQPTPTPKARTKGAPVPIVRQEDRQAASVSGTRSRADDDGLAPSPAAMVAREADPTRAAREKKREPTPAAPEAGTKEMSATARGVWSFVQARRDDPEAQRAYLAAVNPLCKDIKDHPEWTSTALTLAYVHILLGQAEEAREVLYSLGQRIAASEVGPINKAYAELIHRFPGVPQIRRDQSAMLERLGMIDEAIECLEQAHFRDEHSDDIPALERLYRAKGGDSALLFKLVKLLLKTNRLDDAIVLLNELQNDEAYRNRAIKILGLCFWQKGQRQEAWQKFRLLPLSDEVKDIVYRLAIDMEAAAELTDAQIIYERIMSEDTEYRDTVSRLKKIEYRHKLQEEDRQKAQAAPDFQDTRFTILEEVNRGSMGIIFKAKDKVLDEIVVLKVLNDYLCADPVAVERFKREAKAAKRLSHPNIVRIHDMFQNNNKLFLSMEYIDGTDLKRIIAEQTTLSEERILQYFLQICDALGYAHRLGIVHRDIKPANIMITKTDQVKITDFGIAKILRQDDATKSGTAIIGTPLYMAPEQITGEEVRPFSDIYSLGVMLYELVSGNPPFYLGNIEYHHIHTAPPPLPSHVSQRIRDVIMKCLEKNPRDRYQSIEDIHTDLGVEGKRV